MNLSLERLIFDPADADNSPNLGAYVRAGTDGDKISSTLVSGKEGLDVNLINASIAVTATDLDIRDLTHVSDSVKIGDGTDFLEINADGSINVAINGTFDEDSAHVSGDKGVHILAVRNDSQGSLVSADGDYGSLQLDAFGRLRCITDIDLVGDLVADDEVDSEDPLKVGAHAYDQASVWGSVAAGDKVNLASDLYRRVLVNDAPNIAGASSGITIDDTAGGTVIATSALAGRTRMMIQNRGSKSVYVGFGVLTTADGTEISKGGTMSLEVGQAVQLKGICATGETADLRVIQLA